MLIKVLHQSLGTDKSLQTTLKFLVITDVEKTHDLKGYLRVVKEQRKLN